MRFSYLVVVSGHFHSLVNVPTQAMYWSLDVIVTVISEEPSDLELCPNLLFNQSGTRLSRREI